MDSFVTYKTAPCIVCKEQSKIVVPVDGYVKWTNGTSAQNAFPDMTSDQRELLISGIHPSCWETLFREDEKD